MARPETLAGRAPPPARVGLPGQGAGDPLYPYIRPDDLLGALIELFAAEPHLAAKIVNLAACEEAAGKRFPFFDYLFVEAACPAFGAKYHVAAHRLRDAKEREIAGRALIGNQMADRAHG